MLAACGGATPSPPPAAGGPACTQCSEKRMLTDETVSVLRKAGIDPAGLHCNSCVLYGPDLYDQSKRAVDTLASTWGTKLNDTQRHDGARLVLGYLVRNTLEAFGGDNLDVMRLGSRTYGPDPKPLLLFRSGTMPDAGQPTSCLNDLLNHAGVRHVVNLYAGPFPLHDFIATEAKVAHTHGATHYNAADHSTEGEPEWRTLIEKEAHYDAHLQQAMGLAADLINNQVLRPNGEPPKGNILLHCGGGMHRSGMIYGILQRCINQRPMAEIEAIYKYHTEYESDAAPNGYEALNVKFIADFDCGLLR